VSAEWSGEYAWPFLQIDHIMITIKLKNATYEFYQFGRNDWYKWRCYIGVNLCSLHINKEAIIQTNERANELEEVGYISYNLGDTTIILFEGSVYHNVELRDIVNVFYNDSPATKKSYKGFQTEFGLYLMILHNLPNADENNYKDSDIGYLAGLALSEFGFYSIDQILISTSLEITYHEESNSFSDTVSSRFTITGLSPNIDNNKIALLSQLYNAINTFETIESQSIVSRRAKTSLNWYIQSKDALTDINRYLSIWIAIEALILDGSTDLKIIKNAICNIYIIPIDKVEPQFYIGKLFSLRSGIVHKGYNRGMSLFILEYLSTLYHDLLYYSLKIPTREFAKSYLDSGNNRDQLTKGFSLVM
jgi:hypothetical protein